MTSEIDPPFGAYALPPKREAARKKAARFKNTRLGRALISHYRKKALATDTGPFDIEVADGVRARLHPFGNICEKRAFCGVQVWNVTERATLKRAIETSEHDQFVFVDVGANVGLYSLFVNAYAKAAGKSAKIIAIEPSVETGRRLETNVAASGAPIDIVRSAVSDAPGTAFLGGGDVNRGEARLMEKTEAAEPVIVDTLARIVAAHGLKRIDAIKVDIEGHDLIAMTAFFDQAPRELFPSLLILETGKGEDSPLLDMCKTHGYTLVDRIKINAIMTLNNHG